MKGTRQRPTGSRRPGSMIASGATAPKGSVKLHDQIENYNLILENSKSLILSGFGPLEGLEKRIKFSTHLLDTVSKEGAA